MFNFILDVFSNKIKIVVVMEIYVCGFKVIVWKFLIFENVMLKVFVLVKM